MKHILFVCHGNICRSPMAEYIMKHLVHEAGRDADFYIESAATSREEIGNDVYPPARRKLAENGIRCDGHAARQITRRDYDRFDLIVCMDRMNLRWISRIIPEDPEDKIHLLLDFTDRTPGTEVADPWYTGNFDATWRDCVEGCEALLEKY
ncbi:MAG: low molecular weight protein-tyrosine-phosphatase [Bacteroidales bacterium]|nr:low molecular weight protein-tyrosine-phosphatase [Bacteroidales bacterium]